MLNNNALSQLKQLKQQIEDQKEYAIGIVKGTQRRFGFVILEDGREIFLPAEEMDKVFPGDKVKTLIVTPAATNKKNTPSKPSAKLEKLLSSPLTEFTGRYIIKGKGHFIQPDLPHLSRWLFIPPTARSNAKDGDYVRCKISKHPFPHAKPQATILQVIGPLDKKGIEADYVSQKFQLEAPWPDQWQNEIKEADNSSRQDLTHIPFITIDGASTVDLDDALFVEITDNGWRLSVAIADPSAIIPEGGVLEQNIQRRGTSIYLPGHAIPMLPAELANNACSLTPQQQRPALVCSIDISADGTIANYKIIEALVCSQGKLSYQDVDNTLQSLGNNPEEVRTNSHTHIATLTALKELAEALHQHRKQHHLVHSSRAEFRLVLNSERKLDHMEPLTKTTAHLLVEECMIAANRCASDFLGSEGLFIAHSGFRPERLADACKLAQEQLDLTDIDPSSAEGYRQLMQKAAQQTDEFPLQSVLSRLLTRSTLSNQAAEHFGMGLPSYTTFTSPIRKYSDFLVHRIIKQKLQDEPAPITSQQQLDDLQQILTAARQARSEMERWLKCQFLLPCRGQTFYGEVTQINSNGFTVRMDDNHIEGFVDTRKIKEKFSFDPMRLRLKSKQQSVQLEQRVRVTIDEIDCDKRNILLKFASAEEEAA